MSPVPSAVLKSEDQPAPGAQAMGPVGPAFIQRASLLLLGLTAILFILRLAAPPNLLDQDQENPATYVLDVVKNGHWIGQRDLAGNIASKPPVFTWIAAATALLTGYVGVFSLYLPGALALVGTALILLWVGQSWFGQRAAFVAGLAVILSTAGVKQLALARTDGVFACTVTIAAFLAWRAWRTGQGWTWFWLASAVATLTKGPLGLVLASLGLLAGVWGRRGEDRWPWRGNHLPGVALFLIITLGWVALAYRQFGQALIDKLLLRELVFHAVEGEHNKIPGSLLYLSPLYYLARAAPWSLFAYLGAWRVWRYPEPDPARRRFERFLFCWFLGGLFLFSLSPHQRGDLLWPIIPPGALLAGREIARRTAAVSGARLGRWAAAAVGLALLGFAAHYLALRPRGAIIRQTVALRALAGEIERRVGREFPLTHADDTAGLQVYLNTYRPWVGYERAAELLRGPEPAFVCVNNLGALRAERIPGDTAWHTLLEDGGPVTKLRVKVVSNRPQLARQSSGALALGPWTVRYHGALREAHGDCLAFDLADAPGEVIVLNQGQEPGSIRVSLRDPDRAGERLETRRIAPGQSERLLLPARSGG